MLIGKGHSRFTQALAALVLIASESPARAQSYQRALAPGTGQCTFWATRSFTYSPDAAGDSKNPGASVFNAIDAAFATWQALSNGCSDLSFIKGPKVQNATVGYDATNPANNANVIIFRESLCSTVVPPSDPCWAAGTCANLKRCWQYDPTVIALTTTSMNTSTGAILDADTELNAATRPDGSFFLFTTVDSPPCQPTGVSLDCVAWDVQNTLTHEIGHAIGFAHINLPGATMEPTAPLGETQKRTIDPGLAQGFCDIYPKGLPSATCADTEKTRGQVTATAQGSLGVSLLGLTCQASPGGPGLLPAALLLTLFARRRPAKET